MFAVRYFLQFLLLIFGWNFLDQKIINAVNCNIDKSVMIYPHTSYWDFVVVLIYKYAYDLPNLYIVVNEGLYKKYTYILSKLNCIPATAKEKNNGGFVENTVNYFKDKQKYHILISPEGTLKKMEWRSGYYYLAKQLNIDITIIGFDYSEHTIKMRHLKNNLNYTETQNILQDKFKSITPLYPECSYVEIDKYIYTTVFDYCTITTLLFPIYNIYLLYYINIYCCFSSLLMYIFSFLYHHSHESKYYIIEPIMCALNLFFIVYTLCTYYNIHFDLILNFLILCTIVTYYLGMGRHKCKNRCFMYIFFHSIFHIIASISIFYCLKNIKN